MDDDYISDRNRKQVTEKPKHAAEGLFLGAKELGMGIAEGIGGIVYQPIKGGKKEGVKGFFKGIGKGLVGYTLIHNVYTHTLIQSGCQTRRGCH
jgi:vacuolar protein sorting-associated protein 13A/C